MAVPFRPVLVLEIKLSHMGKNNSNPDLVCETTHSLMILDPQWQSYFDCLVSGQRLRMCI